mmetsp:Transcript_112564/g.183514  ORF Transcript_112564/g.183514 Transcript_112564/m.183514 type:complete len:450 (+) Transcript_112564:78-1427(+)
MSKIILVLASLACVGLARRVQPWNSLEGSPEQLKVAGGNHSLQAKVAGANHSSHSLADVSTDSIASMIKVLFKPVTMLLTSLMSFFGMGPKCDVMVVGCGVPTRGMGWYHAKQMLEGYVPHAKCTTIVEPWFLGGGAESPPGVAFNGWANEMNKKYGTKFYKAVGDLPPIEDKMLALVSGRTADNPRLLKELIDAGVTHVYLEKPGAPTVKELEEMREYAKSKGIPVYMGYNKNVASYVAQALEFEAKTSGASTTFIHNNAYKEAELPECFERNAEGMLKNMAIHELALLATFYDVTVDNIKTVTPDTEFTNCLTLKGPSGKTFTDFAKAGFTVETKKGKTVTVKADRCGHESGNSIAVVSVAGQEKFRVETPDAKLKKYVDKQVQEHPDYMPYFFLQDADYITLKERSTAHILSGAAGAPMGMATIDIAVEALKVAEYLTDLMKKASC